MRRQEILFVNDEVGWHYILESRFRHGDYIISHAYGGEEALNMLSAHRYDLIILDLQMPRVSGAEVLRSIRKGRTCQSEVGTPASVKVMVMSCYSESDSQEMAPDADGYLESMLVTRIDLLSLIKRHLD